MMRTNGNGSRTQVSGTRSTRTRYSAQFKAQVVLEVLTGVKTVSEACRAYNLKYESLNRWRSQFLENAHRLFETGQADQEQARIAELERMIGRLSLELEVAKKASSLLSAHLHFREASVDRDVALPVQLPVPDCGGLAGVGSVVQQLLLSGTPY